MPFKISVVDQFCQNILHKGRYGAGVKPQISVKGFDQMFRQDHVSNPQGRGDGLGKGVHVNDVVMIGKGKECFCWFCGNGELGFKIVLDDITAALFRPAEILIPLGCGGGNAAGIAAVRRCVQNISFCSGKGVAVDAGVRQRERVIGDLRRLINLLFYATLYP